jgi:thiamine phosphate synthase YjbQ (UPF0047 family)
VKLHQETVRIEPRGPGLHDVTGQVRRVVAAAGLRTGLVNVCVLHTSASLVVQENADPAVRRRSTTLPRAHRSRKCRLRARQRGIG